jgi:hypothetical protein
MTAQERKNELRKKRYAVVRNAYGDSDLAKTYSGRSDETIYTELGLKVPDRKYVKLRKKPKASTKKRKARELKKVKLMIASGIGAEEARYLRRESYKEINKYIQEIYYIPVDDEDEITGDGIAKTREEERREQWKAWSPKNFPDWVVEMAEKINATTNALGGEDDSYGYAVVYNAYTKEETVDKWMKILKPSRVVADLYEDVRKRG